METAKQRIIVYIDGFNFYYGLKSKKQWKEFYWLDIVKLFEQFIKPHQELIAVKYFSARPADPQKSKRQDAFFQANKENPKFQLILGTYMKKIKSCPYCKKNITTYEEKESDVRLATQIVADAYSGACNASIIVSADSDMIPAIELAREAKHKVYIFFPPNQYSSNLNAMADGRPIQMHKYKPRFQKSILPDVVHLRVANFDLSKPDKWQ